MSTVEQSVEVQVPLSTAYNQWTQFEEFPKFMDGIEEVRQLDDRRLHWVAAIGGHKHEWDAEITEQKPDERIAWRNTDGKENAGVVTFHRLDDRRSGRSPSSHDGVRHGHPRYEAAGVGAAFAFAFALAEGMAFGFAVGAAFALGVPWPLGLAGGSRFRPARTFSSYS